MLKRVSPFAMHKFGKVLSGRENGRKILSELLDCLESLPEYSILPLSFKGVKFLNFSCCDEILTKTISRITSGEIENRYFILVDVSSGIREDITAVMKVRKNICIEEKEDGEITLVGDLPTQLLETYQYILRRKKTTARELAEAMQLKISASSNRLTKLQEMGLLCRINKEIVEGGGRQYIYEPIC